MRFSALGDILMAVPVIDALSRQYPSLDITFVSRPYVESVFRLVGPNVHFIGIEPHGKRIYDIFKLLRSLRPDIVCDLHFMFRTIVIDFLFLLKGVKIHHIVKDKFGTALFLKRRPLSPRKSTFERYAEVFARAGYPLEINPRERFFLASAAASAERRGIGIAPFAAHKGKIYPLEKMEKLVEMLAKREQIYLFGAGEKEQNILDGWARKYPNVKNMAGALENMEAELHFISGLKLMLAMDSGNMHLAALAGTRVLSIWGATHPLAGFLGWGQNLSDCIQAELPCRPCSIYGNKACRYGDYRCLSGLGVEEIYNRIISEICE